MKQLKRIAMASVATAALAMTVSAGSASATTIEVEGVTQNKTVLIRLSLALGSSTTLARTDGSLANTCTDSKIRGWTGPASFTGTTVTTWANTLTFESCTRPVTVHQAGILHIEHIAGTTDGTVSSSGAEVTVGSPFGTLNCKTGSGVDLGRLTGSAGGWAYLHLNAVLNCGFLVPSALWKGTYETTFAEGLGVSA